MAADTWSLPLFPVFLSHPTPFPIHFLQNLSSLSSQFLMQTSYSAAFTGLVIPRRQFLLLNWSHMDFSSFCSVPTPVGYLLLGTQCYSSNSLCVCVWMKQWILQHQMDVFGLHCLKFKEKLIYTRLCCVLVAARGLSLVVASRGYSLLWCMSFSLQWLLIAELGL